MDSLFILFQQGVERIRHGFERFPGSVRCSRTMVGVLVARLDDGIAVAYGVIHRCLLVVMKQG